MHCISRKCLVWSLIAANNKHPKTDVLRGNIFEEKKKNQYLCVLRTRRAKVLAEFGYSSYSKASRPWHNVKSPLLETADKPRTSVILGLRTMAIVVVFDHTHKQPQYVCTVSRLMYGRFTVFYFFFVPFAVCYTRGKPRAVSKFEKLSTPKISFCSQLSSCRENIVANWSKLILYCVKHNRIIVQRLIQFFFFNRFVIG